MYSSNSLLMNKVGKKMMRLVGCVIEFCYRYIQDRPKNRGNSVSFSLDFLSRFGLELFSLAPVTILKWVVTDG